MERVAIIHVLQNDWFKYVQTEVTYRLPVIILDT